MRRVGAARALHRPRRRYLRVVAATTTPRPQHASYTHALRSVASSETQAYVHSHAHTMQQWHSDHVFIRAPRCIGRLVVLTPTTGSRGSRQHAACRRATQMLACRSTAIFWVHATSRTSFSSTGAVTSGTTATRARTTSRCATVCRTSAIARSPSSVLHHLLHHRHRYHQHRHHHHRHHCRHRHHHHRHQPLPTTANPRRLTLAETSTNHRASRHTPRHCRSAHAPQTTAIVTRRLALH